MPVHHCFACDLIFPTRNEVEWHLRNDHGSAGDKELKLQLELAAATRPLDWVRLRQLQTSVSDPSISLFLPTQPAEVMGSFDVARLRFLATKAARRLRGEIQRDRLVRLESRLERVVAKAGAGPTDVGLAILVSAKEIAIVGLPFVPVERVVVDPAFATRDLVDALQRVSRYRLLVIGARPRIFEGQGHHLMEILAPELRRWDWLSMRRQRTLQLADEALDRQILAAGALPLIVVGPWRLLEAFRSSSRHAHALIGEHSGSHRQATLPQLATVAQTALNAWRSGQDSKAVEDLDAAERAGTVGWGLDEAWNAARLGTVNHLWVDRHYTVAARIDEGGAMLSEATDVSAVGVHDDVIDEIIEMTVALGKPVALIEHFAAGGRPAPIAVELGPEDTALIGVGLHRRPGPLGAGELSYSSVGEL